VRRGRVRARGARDGRRGRHVVAVHGGAAHRAVPVLVVRGVVAPEAVARERAVLGPVAGVLRVPCVALPADPVIGMTGCAKEPIGGHRAVMRPAAVRTTRVLAVRRREREAAGPGREVTHRGIGLVRRALVARGRVSAATGRVSRVTGRAGVPTRGRSGATDRAAEPDRRVRAGLTGHAIEATDPARGVAVRVRAAAGLVREATDLATGAAPRRTGRSGGRAGMVHADVPIGRAKAGTDRAGALNARARGATDRVGAVTGRAKAPTGGRSGATHPEGEAVRPGPGATGRVRPPTDRGNGLARPALVVTGHGSVLMASTRRLARPSPKRSQRSSLTSKHVMSCVRCRPTSLTASPGTLSPPNSPKTPSAGTHSPRPHASWRQGSAWSGRPPASPRTAPADGQRRCPSCVPRGA
jgi:hypothetical protein